MINFCSNINLSEICKMSVDDLNWSASRQTNLIYLQLLSEIKIRKIVSKLFVILFSFFCVAFLTNFESIKNKCEICNWLCPIYFCVIKVEGESSYSRTASLWLTIQPAGSVFWCKHYIGWNCNQKMPQLSLTQKFIRPCIIFL